MDASLGMSHYTFATQFRAVYDYAVALFAKGQRGADKFFDETQRAFLAANGVAIQSLYDYAEDHNGYGGEPGYDIALTIEAVRRDYFLNQQHGRPSSVVLDVSTLPDKSATIQGIEWLPRIIPKAKAKLRGEMPSSIMYCCSGDRKFLKANDIFPAEFLQVVWRNEHNDAAIVDWVARQAKR
jgi:hypothetical protein